MELMTRLAVALLVAAVALVAWSIPALAGDIVTMPTANQMGPGEVDVAQYYISFDYPPGPSPGHAYFTTMYVGVTDRIEVDVWYIDADKGIPNVTVLNATGLLLSERKGDPADVVVGVRDIGDDLERMFHPDAGFDRGLFVAAAKTLNPPAGPPSSANTPIWRLHLGVGDELGLGTDPDLDDANQSGVFGGVQALITPQIGAIALWDGTDHIIGVTYTPDPKGPTYKGGVFGDHLWVGVNYTFTR
jgi:hypothetical protein